MTSEKYQIPQYARLAQLAGISLTHEDAPALVRFAEEVAIRATMVEREECASLLSVMHSSVKYRDDFNNGFASACLQAEQAIRARGQS